MSIVLRAINGMAPDHRCGNGDHLRLDLRDQEIATLGVLGGERVRTAVAGKGNAHAIPVQAIGRRAVGDMRLAPVDDFDAVFVIDDAAIVAEVEFRYVDIKTFSDRRSVEVLPMPRQHLLHVKNHVLDAELFRAPGRAGDAIGLIPPATPGTEDVGIRYRREVIPVQMGDENIVDLVQRDPRSPDNWQWSPDRNQK